MAERKTAPAIMEGERLAKIERGVPYLKKRGPIRKYPWLEMKVGDSFLMDVPFYSAHVAYANTAYAPRKFGGQKLQDGKCRVWRTA